MTGALFGVAGQEFRRVLLHPVVLVVGLIVLVIAYINGAGYAETLQLINSRYDMYHLDPFMAGVGHLCASTSMASMIVAAFLGAITIPNDRWNNSLSVLLSKPLYRKDYLLGKFLGLTGFMLLFNAFVFFIIGFMILVFYGGPLSITYCAWKITSEIIALTLACSLIIALNMLFGVLLKNILLVTTATVIYIFVDRLWYNEKMFGGLSALLPTPMYFKILDPTSYVPEIPLTFSMWIQNATPYLVLLLIEILVLLLANIHIFSREDNV